MKQNPVKTTPIKRKPRNSKPFRALIDQHAAAALVVPMDAPARTEAVLRQTLQRRGLSALEGYVLDHIVEATITMNLGALQLAQVLAKSPIPSEIVGSVLGWTPAHVEAIKKHGRKLTGKTPAQLYFLAQTQLALADPNEHFEALRIRHINRIDPLIVRMQTLMRAVGATLLDLQKVPLLEDGDRY